jgi:hypothetical protein
MNIKMNNSSELNTLLIATTVFAIGGLGLFMYNSDKTERSGYEEEEDDDADSQSDSGSDFSIGEEELDTMLEGDFDEEDVSSRKPKKGQTKRTSSRNSKTKKNSR